MKQPPGAHPKRGSAMPVKIESLEIHHIGISGGDATVIVVSYDDAGIMRQVKVLIDAGGEQGTALRLASYFATYFGGASFDYIIASHYHADHIAGFQRCGVDFKCVIDIGGYAIGNTEVRPVNGIGRSESEVFAGYEYYVGTKVQESNGTSRRLNLPFLDADSTLSPRPVEIPLVPTSSDITLTCYCAGGVLADGTNVLRRQAELRVLAREKVTAGDLSKRAKEMARLEADVTEELKKANPNDLSLAFLLEWKSQGFRYWTAGDLSGDLRLTRYANLEEPLIAYLRDKLNHLTTPITVMKATHHGSNHNNYPASVKRVPTYKNTSCEEGNDDDDDMEGTGLVEFKAVNRKGLLDELCPETIIIPCNQMKGVPGGEFVERLEAYCKKDVRKPAVYSEVHPGGLVGSQTGQPRTDVDTHDTCKPLAIFVNECVYPPQSTLQKANVEQLKKLAQSLGKERTNLVVDNVDDKNMMVSNDGPHAVVVFVPALRVDGSRDQLVFHRPGYSVLINNQKSGILA
ncbi:MAG TPA: MBL fold metallo-hydrolase [Longimicrobium sp.]|nr:MBL fold metallo-hydrolase [Longimicrobium sp.]